MKSVVVFFLLKIMYLPYYSCTTECFCSSEFNVLAQFLFLLWVYYYISLSLQDAIHNEHGRDFMGARIVVEWARGPKVSMSPVLHVFSSFFDMGISCGNYCVSLLLQYDHFSDSYRGGRDRDRDRDRHRG